jgi:hypothetical protein
MAYTEAEQLVIPFNKMGDHERKPGKLTHINVWGKYDVASINGFSYCLLLPRQAAKLSHSLWKRVYIPHTLW